MENQREKIKKIFNKLTRKKQIHESIIFLENMNGDISYCLELGDKNIDKPFLTASITKLFTTTCIYMLKEQGKLLLDDKIRKTLRVRYIKEPTYL